jgi:uncharacterized protein (TIGR00369 family)
LEFELTADGGVTATFGCEKAFEGFTDLVHGGIITSLLDGAMTNCIFAHGYVAVTAELTVRFEHPVDVGKPVTVRARIDKMYRPLHITSAEVVQGHEIKATATAKFMECPPDRDRDG